jgi:hypothetical protein
MTSLDLDALEAVAKAAQQGPWSADLDRHCETRGIWDDRPGEEMIIGSYVAADGYDSVAWQYGSDENLTHIATFDPPTVLALIAELRAARAAIREARALHRPLEALNTRYGHRQQVCSGCGTDDGNWQVWPCPTTRALTAPETKEGETR